MSEPVDTPTPTMTQPPATEPAPTATIVWFPPTPTYTPRPAPPASPTPEMISHLADVILEDDFSTGEDWTTGETSIGAVSVMDNELTIAISEEEAFLSSIRWEPVLTDFYLEITANASLCLGEDEYGVMVRVKEWMDAYRFTLACDGNARLDRIVAGSSASIKPKYASGAYLPGSPSISRLGIWAGHHELRFFINDIYQFTITDAHIASGSIGVFARSTGGHSLTVHFSDLVVQSIEE